MRVMAIGLAHERAPANVMRWVRERDLAAAVRAAGRNDPYPCGGGRKFKRYRGLAVRGAI